MNPGLHALLAGAWIGCVLVEALFERALLGKGREQELILARLHWKVDKFVEAPLLVAVALAGGAMIHAYPMDGLLATKLAFAALAILANIWCIWLVKRRLDHAEAGRWEEFERVDHSQHRWGAVVLLGLLGAATLGLLY
ncbi:MAG: hypothetical protein IE933_03885 [Sphingomonadales bacterium]|nr:hypothetical protein [Sphingomonadales bacterium]MBD3772566.1 hypothetical protein [Paracoccaceae bacterium]